MGVAECMFSHRQGLRKYGPLNTTEKPMSDSVGIAASGTKSYINDSYDL